MLKLTRFHLQRYGVAVITVLLALVLTRLLWSLQKLSLYPLFLAAVMVSSWYGGLGAGLLAIVLSALASIYFFIAPIHSLAVTIPSIVGLIQFVLVALLINSLNVALRFAKKQAEVALAKLRSSCQKV
ncbi:DUF4118 domain-containing protein [Scytonema sp. UIC 10036]|uniref:DUF4118 domain-containing protein n=1 Tax=Scytonema sp. UIC 10036 TaxID=2304196 RepID=UPI0012DAC053|nr:DUF4118 domain-containing protein [Scytonema sp. UIC 10036]MUG91412.1 DUF4118 domain-containing protein [Scytonema sp. UIC 10036]